MLSKKILFLSAAFLAVLMTAPNIFASPAQTVNLPDATSANIVEDDDVPDVTARVARISFIKGDVQIKRADSDDWERATLNLPIVEGDEITTAENSRLEIQFNSYSHLRLAENAYLKVIKLKDDGIALSLPQGTLSLRVNDFDKTRSYFEMDAPGTTVAVQHSGTYRLDAGNKGDSEIRVSVTDEGEARIYSDSSGFTLKNGRSARVFISGNNVGEWETGDAAGYADDFASWTLERDAAVAKSLQKAHYDTYYDRDIYGADDLTDYGEWVYTQNYGYVWRPFHNATSSYANWSPYRYGQWRWVPPYGWTWINDEPWGWATYHHGRWFYDDGNWNWTPYGYYRSTRSWWSPALVVVTVYSGNICWYPLPYTYAYYNYNSYYYSNDGHHGGNGGHGGGPTPTPTPPVVVAGDPPTYGKRSKRPPFASVPPTGVVTVKAEEFGRSKGTRMPPLALAKDVLLKIPDDRKSAPPLPLYKDIKGRMSSDIKPERPPALVADRNVKTGAMLRKTDAPLDQELRNTRVFGGRPQVTIKNESTEVKSSESGTRIIRKTGAVERQPPAKRDTGTENVRQPDRKVPDVSRDTEIKQVPRYTPPQREPPRYEAPPAKREDPPARREPPRSEPPVKRDAPPPKNESKPDSKPAPAEDRGGRKKDGRR